MAPLPPRELLTVIEAALLGPASPSPAQRVELLHAVRDAAPAFRTLLTYPGLKASDRAQVESREVRLPGMPPITLDDIDVQTALKLSDELNLNEIECVRLLVDANREWVLYGREPLEIYRLAAGLWYMERRDFITSLYILLRSVALDQGLDADLMSEIEEQIQPLFNDGLRQRIIALVKELNREEPSGIGRPSSERYVLDFRGALVERRAIVSRERLSLSHCLALSSLIKLMSPREVKDVFSILKDCAAEANQNSSTELQITYGVLFSLVATFISDALSTSLERGSLSSSDSSFRREFHGLVMRTGNNMTIEGFVGVVRLAWSVHLMLTQDRSNSREMPDIWSCLEIICRQNSFEFLRERVLKTAAYQNDDEDIVYMYTGYTHKLMMCFISHPTSRDKIKEIKEKAMTALSPYGPPRDHREDPGRNGEQVDQPSKEPFVSLLEVVREIYQRWMHDRNKKAMELVAKGWSALQEVDRVIDYADRNDKRLIPLLRGAKENFELALEIDNDNTHARYWLGKMHFKYHVPGACKAVGAALLVEAANMGDSDAQYELGCRLRIENDYVQSDQQAFHYIEQAVDQLHPGALYLLGAVYLTGDCVKRDIASAMWCFHRASEKGHAGAAITYGSLLLKGAEIPEVITRFNSGKSPSTGKMRKRILQQDPVKLAKAQFQIAAEAGCDLGLRWLKRLEDYENQEEKLKQIQQ